MSRSDSLLAGGITLATVGILSGAHELFELASGLVVAAVIGYAFSYMNGD